MLQSALDVALSVVRANPSVLEGLGAHLEGDILLLWYIILFPTFYSLYDIML